MRRQLYNQLLEWKRQIGRKPLLLQGARQVGKTWLVNEFGKKEYSDIISLNFEQNPGLETLFKGELDPSQIINNVSLFVGRKIQPDTTLIFFDEIQVVPEVLTSLKYFCEQAPEFQIIAAGSLLGISVGKSSSFPVGKIHFLTLYPLSFGEYLTAMGEDLILEELENMQQVKPLPDILHEKLLGHLKMYLYLGGMPEVIQDYFDNQDITSVRRIQTEILEAYQRDFSKYTDKVQAIKTSELWQSIPRQLTRENKKFMYNTVRKNARASTYEQTIEWLKKAGLINLGYNLTVPKLPLSGYADYAKFKVFLHDTGLLGAMLNLSSDIILKPTRLFSEYNGAFIENYVAQQFTAQGQRELYYWTSANDAEVDFVLQIRDDIFPVEVKSGMGRHLKSLHSYADKYHPKRIYRISPRNFYQSGNFINVPLYACQPLILSYLTEQ